MRFLSSASLVFTLAVFSLITPLTSSVLPSHEPAPLNQTSHPPSLTPRTNSKVLIPTFYDNIRYIIRDEVLKKRPTALLYDVRIQPNPGPTSDMTAFTEIDLRFEYTVGSYPDIRSFAASIESNPPNWNRWGLFNAKVRFRRPADELTFDWQRDVHIDILDALALINAKGILDDWMEVKVWRPYIEGEDLSRMQVYYRFTSLTRLVYVGAEDGEVTPIQRKRKAQSQSQVSNAGKKAIPGMLEW